MGDNYMKNIKYLFIIFVLFVFNIYSVNAEECDANDMARLKELAKNVDVKYEYMGKESVSEITNLEKYHITVSGLLDGLSLGIKTGVDSKDVYTANDGKVEFDTLLSVLEIDIFSNNCNYEILANRSINLPRYNYHSEYPECKELKAYNLNICDPWYQGELNNEMFYDVVKKYLKEDKTGLNGVLDFIKKNYILISIGIFLIVGIIAFLLIRRYRRRSVIE